MEEGSEPILMTLFLFYLVSIMNAWIINPAMACPDLLLSKQGVVVNSHKS